MLESYHILVIILSILIAYAVSVGLVKRKKVSLFKHRRFWNYLLLISFLISGLLGLLLAILIDFRLSIAWYRQFLWLHVEFGIAMAVLSTIHVIWHWRYFWLKKPKPVEVLK